MIKLYWQFAIFWSWQKHRLAEFNERITM